MGSLLSILRRLKVELLGGVLKTAKFSVSGLALGWGFGQGSGFGLVTASGRLGRAYGFGRQQSWSLIQVCCCTTTSPPYTLPYPTLPSPLHNPARHVPTLPYPTPTPPPCLALPNRPGYPTRPTWDSQFQGCFCLLSIKFQSFSVWCWGLWPVAYVPTLPDLAYPRPTLP